MRDNVDLNIENLYAAYQKTLSAEDVINENKNVIYGYNKIVLPDKKKQLDDFKFNEGLVRDEYVNSINSLTEMFGKDSPGRVENTRKHIYKLMKILAESDARARVYFDQMQEQENGVVEAFGSDVDNFVSNVGEYTDNTGVKSEGHAGVVNINSVGTSSYSSGTQSYGHTGAANISDNTYTNGAPTKNAESHGSSSGGFASTTYTDGSTKNADVASGISKPSFVDPAAGSIFTLAK